LRKVMFVMKDGVVYRNEIQATENKK
jgi:hypothetical protein